MGTNINYNEWYTSHKEEVERWYKILIHNEHEIIIKQVDAINHVIQTKLDVVKNQRNASKTLVNSYNNSRSLQALQVPKQGRICFTEIIPNETNNQQYLRQFFHYYTQLVIMGNKLMTLVPKTKTALMEWAVIRPQSESIDDICNHFKTIYYSIDTKNLDEYSSIYTDLRSKLTGMDKHEQWIINNHFTFMAWFYDRDKYSSIIEKYTNLIGTYISKRLDIIDNNIVISNGETLQNVQLTVPKQFHESFKSVLNISEPKNSFSYYNFKSMDSLTESLKKHQEMKTLIISYGYSGTGKTYTLRQVLPNKVQSSNTYIYMGDESNVYDTKFVRSTPNNPESSRAFKFMKINEHLTVLDMAGHENPEWFLAKLLPTYTWQEQEHGQEQSQISQVKKPMTIEHDRLYALFDYLCKQKLGLDTDIVIKLASLSTLISRFITISDDASQYTLHSYPVLACYLIFEDMMYLNTPNNTNNVKFVDRSESEKKMKPREYIFKDSPELQDLYILIKKYMTYIFVRWSACNLLNVQNAQLPSMLDPEQLEHDFKWVEQNVLVKSINQGVKKKLLELIETMRKSEINKTINSLMKQKTQVENELYLRFHTKTHDAARYTLLVYKYKMIELLARKDSAVIGPTKPIPKATPKNVVKQPYFIKRVSNKMLEFTLNSKTYTFDDVATLVHEAKDINAANSDLQRYLMNRVKGISLNVGTQKYHPLVQYINNMKYDKIAIIANVRDDSDLAQLVGAYRTLEYVSSIKS